MAGRRFLKQKRNCFAISCILIVILLLIIDISQRRPTVIRKHCQLHRHDSSTRCENCVWDRRFETNTVKYKGGRELPMEMLKNITVLTENQCKHQKFLVYTCDSSRLCGGWADRQKGIVTTFLMALLTNRKFVIDMTNPCSMEESLLPNTYKWSICKPYLKTVPKQNIKSFDYVENYEFNQRIKQYDFEGYWTAKVVVIRFNSYGIDGIRQHEIAKERLKWLLGITNEQVIKLVLNTLFKPSDVLVSDALYFYDTHVKGKPLICCHIRKGKNPSIPNDIGLRFGAPNETVIFEYLKQYDNNSKNVIYIASDSNDVKDNARRNLKSYINIDRQIVHVDRLGNNNYYKEEACEGLYSAILEQFILSLCDKLILTRSGFGTLAAYMRGISENLYMYHPQMKRIIKTNLTDVQTVFNFS